VEEKDMDSEWIEFKESKNMKNKDSLVICDSCANNDETCTECNSCVSGSNFVRKVINCTDDCTDFARNDAYSFEPKACPTTQKVLDPKARYYDAGGVEVLDVIKAKLTSEQFKGWLLGNLIKYSCRANHKGQFDRDVEKIKFYSAELFGILEV